MRYFRIPEPIAISNGSISQVFTFHAFAEIAIDGVIPGFEGVKFSHLARLTSLWLDKAPGVLVDMPDDLWETIHRGFEHTGPFARVFAPPVMGAVRKFVAVITGATTEPPKNDTIPAPAPDAS
jgi:hypothetical protein